MCYILMMLWFAFALLPSIYSLGISFLVPRQLKEVIVALTRALSWNKYLDARLQYCRTNNEHDCMQVYVGDPRCDGRIFGGDGAGGLRAGGQGSLDGLARHNEPLLRWRRRRGQ